MTLIIAGGLVGAAAALIELTMRRIRQATFTAVNDTAEIVGIRRHSSATDVWPNTTPAAGVDNNAFFGRHRSDPEEVIDPEMTEVIEYGPATGRHSAENPNRQLVDTRIEELRWGNGSRSVRPFWMPPIGDARIAWITTPTSEYAIAKRPLSPFSNLTRPARPTAGKVLDSYYQFVGA